jgi:hypothetical protein
LCAGRRNNDSGSSSINGIGTLVATGYRWRHTPNH